MSENSRQYIEFGEFRLDTIERRLMRGEKIISLTPKAFEMLRLLVENEGHLLGKDRLMEELWADTFVDENNLADNVSKIRNALGDSRKEPKFIETVSGHGYRFIAKVVVVEAEKPQALSTGSVQPEDESDPPTSQTGVQNSFFQASVTDYVSHRQIPAEKAAVGRSTLKSTQKQPAPPAKTGWHRSRILAAAGAFILIGIVVFYVWNRDPVPTADNLTLRSIAVLPFKPITANERDESLELGMSDTLITRLSSIGQITVRPMSAVRRYTDLEQDAVAAGRELQVESVLEGNIQRAGERIRISARLVRVIDEKTLWTETFDEKFTDIFAVQDSISQKIVVALALHLSGEEQNQLTKKYTADTEAYQLYLQGRYFWNKVTPEGFEKSLVFYRQAIAIDPNYALAYAGLADSYNLLGSYGVLPLKESHPKARAAAEKALEIDGELAEAHTSLATVIADYYWDWAEAEKHFKQAIALNPNYPVARNWYSQHLARMGRFEEAIEEAKRAQTLDPLSPSAN
ncbi:MAG: winged helix-turn-helix domain-containing protein, partial [Blastocatellia bacterium]|nr:winged helix-turn-helix domain-containing protein [Blastocatellia bacterium]